MELTVIPTYEHLYGAHSLKCINILYAYMILVCFKIGCFGVIIVIGGVSGIVYDYI